MSRAGLYGSLLAAGTAILLVSCARNQNYRVLNREGSVHIFFTCNTNSVKVGLVGDDGDPAWRAERRRQQRIGWVVQPHVTINAIRLKTGGSMPIDVTQNPSGPGTPLLGTVTGAPDTYPYNIDVTCQQNENTVRLIIDPEMIVR